MPYPSVGPEHAQGACASTRATFVMADVNATVEPLQGRLIKPVERTIIDMFMALDLKK
tara:strand:- start:77 stop:250 length:174 start_codon:yes stop_codon:yes gene_type:complete